MDGINLLRCLAALFCWGVAPVIYRFCGSEMPPSKMQAVRSLSFFAAALLAVCIAPGGGVWPGLWPCAVLIFCTVIDLGVGDSLYFVCVSKIGAGKASALTNTYPLYAVALSWLILGEGLSPLASLGALTVVGGLLLLCLFKEKDADSGYGRQPLRAGLLWGILAGMCWSTGHVVIRWAALTSGIGASGMMFWRAAALLGFAWQNCLRERARTRDTSPLLPLNTAGGLMMLATGVLVLMLPGWLVATALQTVPPSIVAPITGASPAVAALLGRILFKEPISPPQWLGIALIIIGGAAVNLF